VTQPLDVRTLPGAFTAYTVRGQGYFPVITGLGGQELAVVLRGGAGHVGVAGRLDVVRSSDGGRTWTAPVTAADSERDDRNPAFGVAPDGTLILAYHWQGSYNEKGEWDTSLNRQDTRIVYSSDRGKTWRDDGFLAFPALNGASPFGKILTHGKAMYMMLYAGPTIGVAPTTFRVGPATTPTYILKSTDNGCTWTDPVLVAVGLNESDLVILPDGVWLFAARSEQEGEQAIYLCRSDDEGRTWHLAGRITEQAEHPPDLTLLGNGWLLLTFGHRHPPYGVQGIVSRDGGITWDNRRLILDDGLPGGDSGYPSTIRMENGRLVTVYYTAGTREKQWEIYTAVDASCKVVGYDEKTLIEAFG